MVHAYQYHPADLQVLQVLQDALISLQCMKSPHHRFADLIKKESFWRRLCHLTSWSFCNVGLPSNNLTLRNKSHSSLRQNDSFVPSTSGSEEEDDLYLLAKSIFDLKVSTTPVEHHLSLDLKHAL